MPMVTFFSVLEQPEKNRKRGVATTPPWLDEGKHVKTFYHMYIFLLGCTASKYGSACEKTCATCYNGGFCHDTSGICICPPGFKGLQCEKGK